MALSYASKLDQWRREAYDYSSSSDRLGIVISRAIELLMVVMRNGTGAENLKYAIESLRWERNLARNPAMDGEGTLRTHVHRLCEAMELTMESLIDGGKTEPTTDAEAPSTSNVFAANALVKEEDDLFYHDLGSGLKDGPVKIEEEADVNTKGINEPVYDISSEHSLEEEQEEEKAPLPPRVAPVGESLRSGRRLVRPKGYSPAPSSSKSNTPPPSTLNNKCHLCGATFVRPRDLRRHLRDIDHTVGHRPRKFRPERERRFKCDECDVEYSRVDNLNRHKLVHEGRAPRIQCPHCPAVLQTNLNGHLRDVHHINPYVCETCGETFGRLNQLHMHALTCIMEAP